MKYTSVIATNGSGYGVGFLRIWNTKPNTMSTEEKELWAKVINDARWYDGTPKMLQQLTEHFNKQGITVKNCSIPNVVGRSEQFICYKKDFEDKPKCSSQCRKCGEHECKSK